MLRGGTLKTKLLIALAFVFLLAGAAYASYLPDGVEEFRNDCGYICYVWPDGSGDCYACFECNIETPTPVPSPEPTVIPPITETPEPKESCNRGLGNGSEDCDPGNSGGKPGAAGEDNE